MALVGRTEILQETLPLNVVEVFYSDSSLLVFFVCRLENMKQAFVDCLSSSAFTLRQYPYGLLLDKHTPVKTTEEHNSLGASTVRDGHWERGLYLCIHFSGALLHLWADIHSIASVLLYAPSCSVGPPLMRVLGVSKQLPGNSFSF